MGFTQGEWIIYPTNHPNAELKIATGQPEEGIAYLTKTLWEEWEANANLISAAPNYYTRLKETTELIESVLLPHYILSTVNDLVADLIKKNKKALAKAEGRTNGEHKSTT